ncbi:MAG: PHB depolymerase family esterase [Burkholderiaceae bacterium]|nr:PHB depolymerase family esterase [Burkholderiaceae bacterium]
MRAAQRLARHLTPKLAQRKARASQPAPALSRKPGSEMSRRSFTHEGSRIVYWLHVPTSGAGERMPLILMLHCCKQSAAEFAASTGMNAVADRLGFAVAYAQQTTAANRMRCWNWFERRNQGRAGEAALLAALALDAARKAGADRARVYVAGLSAGAAMALNVAGAYPEVFAAAAAHSGVPEGSAGDVFSGLRVMKHGPRAPTSAFGKAATRTFVPTIVIHGSADRTVHPANGDAIWAATVAAARAAGLDGAIDRGEVVQPGRRNVTRLRLADAGGAVVAEHWAVQGLGHAWSGGAREEAFSDPMGVDASTAIAGFVLAHRLADARA